MAWCQVWQKNKIPLWRGREQWCTIEVPACRWQDPEKVQLGNLQQGLKGLDFLVDDQRLILPLLNLRIYGESIGKKIIYIYNIDTYMYMYIYICNICNICICIYVHMYICIYVYVYIYIYMHTSFYRYDISGILSATPRWDPVKPVLFATKPGSSAAQVFSRPQKDREVTSHLKEPLSVLLSKGFF